MLAIRMQRTGRKKYPTYRVIVQEAHRQPTSGRVVANIGTYNPHTKVVTLDKEKAALYLKNGAQPSDRVVRVLESEKVALPAWVKKTSTDKQKTIKNVEKLRRNQPEEAVLAEDEEVVAEDVTTEAEAIAEVIAEEQTPEVAEEVSVEEIAEAEVADGQETAEEEAAAAVEEDQEEKPAEA
ncbi:30S ribosomal protein S16 [Candidatus Saccharibacteria bacterium]|nr:30S ribosomal protein S16 [Candidatus Saccharibacteria bacterium]